MSITREMNALRARKYRLERALRDACGLLRDLVIHHRRLLELSEELQDLMNEAHE